jgi:type II secretory pathway pseudopilin PulG
MQKRGDIWISAVIYIALGIVILTIVLAVGLPTISKMKDTYTAKQTKEIMLTLDSNVRSVYNQGPGAQTQVKLKIGKGELNVNSADDKISWTTRTKALLSEPDVPVQEGNLIIFTESSAQKGEYDLYLTLDYSQIDIVYSEGTTIKGTTLLSITNAGGGEIKLTKL